MFSRRNVQQQKKETDQTMTTWNKQIHNDQPCLSYLGIFYRFKVNNHCFASFFLNHDERKQEFDYMS